jgi:hydroxyacylglutathione hydrolase
MFVKQFQYSADNLGYLLYGRSEGIAIDAGAVQDTLKFAKKNHIKIKYLTNTHSHHDHTSGNEKMLQAAGAQFIDSRDIRSDTTLSLDQEILQIMYTPGHTDDCITFKADDFIITGDTLFNGTIGNCFSGDFHAFFQSLKKLISLPKETKIYSGHDYVKESIEMAKSIEKDNLYFKAYMKKYNPNLVVSSLDDELKVNPFLRFNSPEIINRLKKRNMPAHTEFERFNSIMEVF